MEVKYRSSNIYGDGVAAITAKKLQQMRFAAEIYNARYKTELASRLVVVSINEERVLEFLEVE